MPITLHHDNLTTLRLVYEGRWTWEEFYKGTHAVDNYLGKADNVTDLIVDLSASDHLPPSALTHLRNIKHDTYPTFGRTVIVTRSLMLRAMGELISHIKPSLTERVSIVSSLNAAYVLLEQDSVA